MTFEEQLPALIVLGYGAAAGLGYLGGKWSGRAKTWALTLAWLLGIATTVTWLVVAVGVSGLVTIVSLLVFAPLAITYLVVVLGRLRRRRAGGDIDSVWPRMFLGGGALCFLILAANTMINGLTYFIGLAYDVELHVTGSHQGSSMTSRTTVSGEYLLHGENHVLDHVQWLAFEQLPAAGETIRVAIGPLWPNPLLANATNAGLLMALGIVAAIPGVLLTMVVAREKANARNHREQSVVVEDGRHDG
ncbi:hypothetical protein SAMN05216266_10818 [Amycolatopsis marina]|uniref:Uncharacterized protein n=1 Tax=Amycolatopsis marina TaxID=490629 RepID=A0A1I0ZYS9_9PSEU|nr:hypothetical protein [Amycolatopsis marina]SFB30854.1 hypothetical protein SAMN05216266_10818 [Amycolatopsis marina]